MQLRMHKIYASPLIVMVAQLIKCILDAYLWSNLLFLQLVQEKQNEERTVTNFFAGIYYYFFYNKVCIFGTYGLNRLLGCFLVLV